MANGGITQALATVACGREDDARLKNAKLHKRGKCYEANKSICNGNGARLLLDCLW